MIQLRINKLRITNPPTPHVETRRATSLSQRATSLSRRATSPAIGIWKIKESWQDLLAMFQNPTWVAEEVRCILSDSRKCERLAVRLLVRDLTGLELKVCYKDNGAPYLTDSPFNISISHTKGFAAVILSKLPHPGIDIEYRSERAWKLRTKFLNATELEVLESKPAMQQATIATICWCAKETAYKALQETGVDFIKHFHISPFAVSEPGRLQLKETKTAAQETYQIQYQTTDDYILTWKA